MEALSTHTHSSGCAPRRLSYASLICDCEKLCHRSNSSSISSAESSKRPSFGGWGDNETVSQPDEGQLDREPSKPMLEGSQMQPLHRSTWSQCSEATGASGSQAVKGTEVSNSDQHIPTLLEQDRQSDARSLVQAPATPLPSRSRTLSGALLVSSVRGAASGSAAAWQAAEALVAGLASVTSGANPVSHGELGPSHLTALLPQHDTGSRDASPVMPDAVNTLDTPDQELGCCSNSPGSPMAEGLQPAPPQQSTAGLRVRTRALASAPAQPRPTALQGGAPWGDDSIDSNDGDWGRGLLSSVLRGLPASLRYGARGGGGPQADGTRLGGTANDSAANALGSACSTPMAEAATATQEVVAMGLAHQLAARLRRVQVSKAVIGTFSRAGVPPRSDKPGPRPPRLTLWQEAGHSAPVMHGALHRGFCKLGDARACIAVGCRCTP
jgi:hypothetical protein